MRELIKKLSDDITAATVEGVAEVVQAASKTKPTYPSDHVAGMRVPKGGSNCAKCEYLADNKTDCTNEYFQKWNGSPVIPGKIDEYCSDWFIAKKDMAAGGLGSGRHKEIGKLYKIHDDIQSGPWTEDIPSNESRHTYMYAYQRNLLSKLGDGLERFAEKQTNSSIAKEIRKGHSERMQADVYARQGNYSTAVVHHDNALNRYHNALEELSGNKELNAATENSQAGVRQGTIWHGIKITGFTGPEEDGIRAMLSRIPPELLTNVVEIQSAKELNAKHGRYLPSTKIVQFNPKDFTLRQRFGKGEGWIYHAELTVVHEVFHSLYDALPSEKKEEWLALGGWMQGTKQGQSPAHVEGRPGWVHETSTWTHKAGVVFPRYYSEKDPNEAFADCGAFYVLGKAHQMSPQLKQFMDQFIQDNVKHYPRASIESPEKPRP